MWFRLRLDISRGQLARAAWQCLVGGDGARAERELRELWPGPHASGCFLSVRSGFDLLLSALELPPGSEVLMSALTIPDMIEVVRAHDLVPVPLDLDPETGRADGEALQAALSPRTRVVLIAHLSGDLTPLDPLLGRLEGSGILLIEDCAQAYSGLGGYTGHAAADVSMFSFGPIKTATALGGALFNVRDAEVLGRMQALQAHWPEQSGREYLRRVLTYSLLSLATSRGVYTFLEGLARSFQRDFDGYLVRSARSFGGASLLEKIRKRPGAALLCFLTQRVRHYDGAAVGRRRRHARLLAALLARPGEPDLASEQHAWWLFPVLEERPADLQRHLRAEGFDSSAGHSLVVVPERAPACNRGARSFLERVLFVPIYPSLPDREVERLGRAILSYRGSVSPVLREPQGRDAEIPSSG
jgi:dTDP-4-amino-4,6-dideoxygalactose transaminase